MSLCVDLFPGFLQLLWKIGQTPVRSRRLRWGFRVDVYVNATFWKWKEMWKGRRWRASHSSVRRLFLLRSVLSVSVSRVSDLKCSRCPHVWGCFHSVGSWKRSPGGSNYTLNQCPHFSLKPPWSEPVRGVL